jgi:hypothetical protein
MNLCGTKLPPLGRSGGSFEFEMVSDVEGALLIEVVMDERRNGGELLQTSHLPEAKHYAFSSSKRQVRILRAIVHPAARFLPLCVANNLHRGTIRSERVR